MEVKVKASCKPKRGANKIKRVGSRKALIVRYYSTVYGPRKLRRVLKNNGVAAARSYADKHGLIGEFNRLTQG